MEAYSRRYIDLCMTYKRMKSQLDLVRQKREQAKDNLYKFMVKSGVEETSISVKNQSGVNEEHKIIRNKIKPQEKKPRKKKREVEEDIAQVLEARGIDHAQDLVKEIETARKSKIPVQNQESNNRKVKYGDVIYK